MTPLYLRPSHLNASSAVAAADASTSSASSAQVSDPTSRRPSNVIMHPPKPMRKKKTHSTDPFLRDFTLVAEAARRAQLSILRRDMERIDLSPSPSSP